MTFLINTQIDFYFYADSETKYNRDSFNRRTTLSIMDGKARWKNTDNSIFQVENNSVNCSHF